MILSGGIDYYRCDACGSEYASVTPTSLLPWACVVSAAGVCWEKVLTHFISHRWIASSAGMIIATASLWLIYQLIEVLTNGQLRRGKCPKCGAPLRRTGGGWYDGMVPNPWELLIYVLTIGLAFAAAKLIGR